MTVYGDVLFLVNFSMDLLTLCFASRITHRMIGRFRLILGGIFGGIGGTVLAIADQTGIAGKAGSLAVMCGMTLIAFGTKGGWLRNSLIVCGSGTLLGGIMTAILSMGEPVAVDYGSIYPSVFLGCTAAAWCFTRLLASSSAKKTAQTAFTVRGETYTFMALRDSGSFLADPVSGTPVITVSEKVIGIPADRIAQPKYGFRVRIIPVRTVTGEGMLYGFIPDSVTVDGMETRAVIAVDTGERGGFDGIVPAGLSIIHKESEL